MPNWSIIRTTIEKDAIMTRMHNPPHPGEVLHSTVLQFGAAALSVTEFAKRLGGSAESWLRMQVAYDLWQAQKKPRSKIRPLEVRRVA